MSEFPICERCGEEPCDPGPLCEGCEEIDDLHEELELARRVIEAARSIYYRPEQDGGRLVSAKEFDQMQVEIAAYDAAVGREGGT